MESGMQITINVKPGATNKDIAAQLRFQAGLIEGMEPKKAASRDNTNAAEAAPLPVAKPAAAPKTAAKPKAAAAVQEESFDLEADESEDGLELSEEASEVKAPEITKDDVIRALQAYVKKHDRDKAITIVKKFAKSGAVKDLSPDQYIKVLKALGA